MFSLIIPFHSDYAKIKDTLPYIIRNSAEKQIDEIILVHNGPSNYHAFEEEIRDLNHHSVFLVHTDDLGLGAGYRLGIQKAIAEYVVLTANDLPFGFTDIDAFKKLASQLPAPPLFCIGSKAHPDSQITKVKLVRSIFSQCFYYYRRLVLGSQTPQDSQGSFIINTNLAKKLLPKVKANDYFFSLEIATHHLWENGQIYEIPIELQNEYGKSSVNLFSDSLKMAWATWRLRTMKNQIQDKGNGPLARK
jgi:dolichyl-phosphate beta-glucosyltransferase